MICVTIKRFKLVSFFGGRGDILCYINSMHNRVKVRFELVKHSGSSLTVTVQKRGRMSHNSKIRFESGINSNYNSKG